MKYFAEDRPRLPAGWPKLQGFACAIPNLVVNPTYDGAEGTIWSLEALAPSKYGPRAFGWVKVKVPGSELPGWMERWLEDPEGTLEEMGWDREGALRAGGEEATPAVLPARVAAAEDLDL